MTPIGAAINITIQFFGLFGVYYLGWIWAIYPTMFLLVVIAVLQSVASAGLLSQVVDNSTIKADNENLAMRFLVVLTYSVSVYQIYILGFHFFAGIAAFNVVVLLITLGFRSLKGL